VHGADGLAAAERITHALFHSDLSNLTESDWAQLKLDGLPSTTLNRADLRDKPLTQLLSESGVVASGKQIKDALARKAVFVNSAALSSEDNMRTEACFAPENALFGNYYLVKVGKKNYHLFDFQA